MLSLIHGLAGGITGVLSAFGLGGGTLLLLYLTFLAGFSQQTAQGINLLYFLPSAGAALPRHLSSGMIHRETAVWAGAAGCAAAIAGALAAVAVETTLLRKLFGGYLIVMGILMLVQKPKKTDSSPDGKNA